MKKMEIKDLEKIAIEVLEKYKNHRPNVFLVKNDKLDIIQLSFTNDQEKNDLLENLREKIISENIKKYFIVMETWVSQNVFIRPRDSKERKEMLLIQEYKKSEPQKPRMIMRFFHRENDEIVWDERTEEIGEYKSIWNFYMEDVMEETIQNARVEKFFEDNKEDIIKKIIKENSKELGLDPEQVFQTLKKMVKEGKLIPREKNE